MHETKETLSKLIAHKPPTVVAAKPPQVAAKPSVVAAKPPTPEQIAQAKEAERIARDAKEAERIAREAAAHKEASAKAKAGKRAALQAAIQNEEALSDSEATEAQAANARKQLPPSPAQRVVAKLVPTYAAAAAKQPSEHQHNPRLEHPGHR